MSTEQTQISLTPLKFFPTETHFQHFCIDSKEIRHYISRETVTSEPASGSAEKISMCSIEAIQQVRSEKRSI